MDRKLRVHFLMPGDVDTPPWDVTDHGEGGYGGTEAQGAMLAGLFAQAGHKVTVSATATSTVGALHENITLQPNCDVPVSKMESVGGMRERTVMWTDCAIQGLRNIMKDRKKPDVIINSTGHLALGAAEIMPRRCARLMRKRSMTIMHGRVDHPFEQERYRRFRKHHYIAISDAQQKSLPEINWLTTIHHGIDLKQFQDWQPEDKQDYAVFFGRICEDKGTHLAIEAAKRAGIRLVIAGKIDQSDRDYFRRYVEPHVDGVNVVLKGEMGPVERDELLGRAMILLHPNKVFPEPFGLVLIEALACNTPVIGWNNGSVPEIIKHGKTGYICDNIDQMVEAIRNRNRLDHAACRRDVEARFTKERMFDDYERAVYALAANGFRPRSARLLTRLAQSSRNLRRRHTENMRWPAASIPASNR